MCLKVCPSATGSADVKQELAQGFSSLLLKPQDSGYRCVLLQQEHH